MSAFGYGSTGIWPQLWRGKSGDALASITSSIGVRRRSLHAGATASLLSANYAPARIAALLIADSFAVIAAGIIGWWFWRLSGAGSTVGLGSLAYDLVVPAALVFVYLVGRGRYDGRITFWVDLQIVTGASLFAAAIVTGIGAFGGKPEHAFLVASVLILFAALSAVSSQLTKEILTRVGLWTLPAVVIGDGPSAVELAAALHQNPTLGYSVVGTVGPSALWLNEDGPRLRAVLAQFHARFALIAAGDNAQWQRMIIEAALRERVPFATVVPPGFACRETQLFGHDAMLLSRWDGLSRPIPRFVKAAMDISLAALMLLIASPLLLAIAMTIRLDGGPALFAHRRVGTGGRHFRCLKFRTMVVDADRVLEEAIATDPELAAEWSATRKLRKDPRVTRIGRILRRTSLDELPQLINVIRLEMSLVGPRPIVDSEVSLYGENIADYFAARPGLTGLWQVSGRSNTSYARRVQLDVWYVRHWTIWCDIAVLLKTIPAVLSRDGAR